MDRYGELALHALNEGPSRYSDPNTLFSDRNRKIHMRFLVYKTLASLECWYRAVYDLGGLSVDFDTFLSHFDRCAFECDLQPIDLTKIEGTKYALGFALVLLHQVVLRRCSTSDLVLHFQLEGKDITKDDFFNWKKYYKTAPLPDELIALAMQLTGSQDLYWLGVSKANAPRL